jgi:hypothetical protein
MKKKLLFMGMLIGLLTFSLTVFGCEDGSTDDDDDDDGGGTDLTQYVGTWDDGTYVESPDAGTNNSYLRLVLNADMTAKYRYWNGSTHMGNSLTAASLGWKVEGTTLSVNMGNSVTVIAIVKGTIASVDDTTLTLTGLTTGGTIAATPPGITGVFAKQPE